RKWNLGNYYVDYLLAKDVAMNEGLDVSDPNSPGLFEDKHLEAIKDRVGMLRVVTNSEIKSKNDPDSVEYKSIGLADLIVSNISKLWYSQVEISDMFNQERKLSKRHVIKPLSPVDFSADKSSSFMIEGMPDLSNINITL